MIPKVIGIGGAILDQILPVSEAYLKTIPGKKGGMEPIDFETLSSIISKSESKPISMLGGCSRNILEGLTRLGHQCSLLGMIGPDQRGMNYRKLLAQKGIGSLLIEGQNPTAIVLSMITPDGERTMRTFQGASTELRGADLKAEMFYGADLVHVEGYALFNEDLAERAMFYAKKAGALISFDMASFEVVAANRALICDLLRDYIDIVFANIEEANALCNCPPTEAAMWLAKQCEVGVVLMGEQGALIAQADSVIPTPAYRVNPIDTTGAGDLYASGFLHGYLNQEPLEQCAHYGAVLGRAVVQVMGPVIPNDFWEELNCPLRTVVSTVEA